MVLVFAASDDDDESQDSLPYHGPTKIVVNGAGQSAVDGVYVRDGSFEGASKFSRQGEYGGKLCTFSIFQCTVSNNTKLGFICIVPTGYTPRTRDDTDFYSVPAAKTCQEFPPLSGWTTSYHGLDPPPTSCSEMTRLCGQKFHVSQEKELLILAPRNLKAATARISPLSFESTVWTLCCFNSLSRRIALLL